MTPYRCTTCRRITQTEAASLTHCTCGGQAWERLYRYCTRCGLKYDTTEPRCLVCHNPEFSIDPVSQGERPVTKKKTATKKPKSTKAKKPTANELLTEAAEILKKVEKAEERTQEALRHMQDLKDEYKTAKECYNGAVSELRRLARARKEKLPLFDQAKPAPKAGEQPTADSKADASPATDDAWKAMGLSAAAFKENHQEALEAAGLKTLGELSAKMNQHSQWWAKEIGVNERFRVAIEDAFNAYLMQVVPPKPEENPTEEAANTAA